MQLIEQHIKSIMEECKRRASKSGLNFDNESLEYIVTNKDLLQLSPKLMIPTIYDYWVHDVELLKGEGIYKVYPYNPFETVINSRPAISFYNDNNPDWLNVMIFYHVLGHIDFFQNNIFFQHTWSDDFVGQALADKRLITTLRSTHGRWLDYVIEFARCIDNLTGYYSTISKSFIKELHPVVSKEQYYFEVFLQEEQKASVNKIQREVEEFNELLEKDYRLASAMFFSEVKKNYPEFEAMYQKYIREDRDRDRKCDVMEYIRDHSKFLREEKNIWMKGVIDIVRNTSLYFAPQIRTKIINEGWASYWHDYLFRNDDRIQGNEIAYSRVNAEVTSLNRLGLNPYAIGLRLLQYVEELADKGKLQHQFQKLLLRDERKLFNQKTGKGKEVLFNIRTYFSDHTLISTFVDQDFVDQHQLFVSGKRLNKDKGVYEYYVKSRKAEDYKQMLLDSLYHPPHIVLNLEKSSDDIIYLNHFYEGKQLVQEYIPDVMMAIEYLWGGEVKLETSLIHMREVKENKTFTKSVQRVVYTQKDRKLTKKVL